MSPVGVLEHFAYVVAEMFAVEGLCVPQVLRGFRPLSSALPGVYFLHIWILDHECAHVVVVASTAFQVHVPLSTVYISEWIIDLV